MTLKKTIINLSIFSVVFLSIVFLLSRFHYKAYATINGVSFVLDVADTNYLLSKGLSNRKSISKDEGMLFIFKSPGKSAFWMKDMNFPIDIVWLDENLRVIYIKSNISPETYPEKFVPDRDFLYVLEISAGRAKEVGIEIGDEIKFLKKWF